jgi:hypothetical protein
MFIVRLLFDPSTFDMARLLQMANDAAMVTTVRSAQTVAQPKACHVIKAGAGCDNWSAATPNGW